MTGAQSPIFGYLLGRRAYWIYLGLIAAISAVTLLQPGFNRLNYYFALSIGLALPPICGLFAIRLQRYFMAEAGGSSSAQRLLTSIVLVSSLGVVPLLTVMLGAIWIKNCSFGSGLLFFMFGAGFGMLLATALGLLLASLTSRSRLWFLLIWFGSLLWSAKDLYFQPVIFLYNPFVGFFSGAIYDEVIVIGAPFVWYRAQTLAQIALLLLLYHWTAGSTGLLAGLRSVSLWRKSLLALLVASIAVLFVLGGRLGFDVSRGDIQRELGGRDKSEHFVFHYDRRSQPWQIKGWKEDHEFRHFQLSRYLDVDVERVIHSYIYRTSAQKRRLMGAGQTFVAKPWAGEVYLNSVNYGDSVVTHELAHVFGARFGHGPFKLAARYGVLVNMALVEGLAVAAEWDEGDYTAHQFAAAIRVLKKRGKLKRAPDLLQIMGTLGFWKQYSGTAYTISGSFVRFLIEAYGVERFKKLYAGATFNEAFDASLESLVSRWRRFLDDRRRVTVDQSLLRRTAYRFSRHGVLYRVCGNEIARLEKLSSKASQRKNLEQVLAIRRVIDSYVPNHPARLYRLMGALIALRKFAEARSVAQKILKNQTSSEYLRGFVQSRLGDIHWLLDERPEALKRYARVVELQLTRSTTRGHWIKIKALQNPRWGSRIRHWFLNPRLRSGQHNELLLDLYRDYPGEPLIGYLLGRRLYGLRLYREALAVLGSIDHDRLPQADFGFEIYRMTAQALYFLGEWGQARRTFKRLLRTSKMIPRGQRNRIADWIERCRWKAAQKQ